MKSHAGSLHMHCAASPMKPVLLNESVACKRIGKPLSHCTLMATKTTLCRFLHVRFSHTEMGELVFVLFLRLDARF